MAIYTGRYGQGKQVIAKACHEDLATAIHLCAEEFMTHIGRAPTKNIDALEKELFRETKNSQGSSV